MENKLYATVTVQPEGGERMTYTLLFEECGNNSGYGSGQYVAVYNNNAEFAYVDFRYMVDYTLKKAADAWLEGYYGGNLVKVQYKLTEYVFGANYDPLNGREEQELTTIKIPAPNETIAWDRLIKLVGDDNANHFRLDDFYPYE